MHGYHEQQLGVERQSCSRRIEDSWRGSNLTYTNFRRGQPWGPGRCSLDCDWTLPLSVGGRFDENHVVVVGYLSWNESGNRKHKKPGTDVHRTEDLVFLTMSLILADKEMLNRLARVGVGSALRTCPRARSNPNPRLANPHVSSQLSGYRLPRSHSVCGNSVVCVPRPWPVICRGRRGHKEAAKCRVGNRTRKSDLSFVGKAGLAMCHLFGPCMRTNGASSYASSVKMWRVWCGAVVHHYEW